MPSGSESDDRPAGDVAIKDFRTISQSATPLLLITGVGLTLSLAPPFAAAAQTSTALWLVGMPLATAAPVLALLQRALPPHRAPAHRGLTAAA